VNERLSQWLRNYTKVELCRMSSEAGVPLAPVATTADVVSSEQLRGRDFFVQVEHAEIGKVLTPTTSFKMEGVPSRATLPPPLLGQHNGEVYVDRLGYSKQELGRLRCCSVI